ncbi:MAG: rod shape-determining protein MreD [Bdellovibrionales bacterium]|nr:rod shape-determining protein MreD [Bdellovibrionales bacterium]
MSPMRYFFTIFVLGLLGVLIQGTFFRFFLSASFVPHLLLLLTLYLAFYETSVLGVFLSFFLGLLLDLSTGLLLGPWAASFVVVYCFLSLVSDRIFVESGLAAVVISFFSTIGLHIVHFLLATNLRPALSEWGSGALIQGVMTGICAPFLFHLFRRLFHDRRGGVRASYGGA